MQIVGRCFKRVVERCTPRTAPSLTVAVSWRHRDGRHRWRFGEFDFDFTDRVGRVEVGVEVLFAVCTASVVPLALVVVVSNTGCHSGFPVSCCLCCVLN